MIAELLVLRLVHVLGGILWVGGSLLNVLFFVPALGAAGPAAGPVMGHLRARRLHVIMPVVALLTVLSGLRLLWIVSGDFQAAWFATGAGATYTVSGALALIAFLIGVAWVAPAARRMGGIGPALVSAPDDATRASLQAELARMQKQLQRLGTVATVMITLAAAGMAVARYV